MIKSLASMSSLNLVKAAVQFAIASAVSLFVQPTEYGLIAFSTPIYSFIALFTDMGLSSAVVRQHELARDEAGAAFTFSLAIAFAAALVLGMTAWPLQAASHLTGLAPVLLALTLAVVCNIAASIPRALLERQLRYQTIAAYEMTCLLLAAAASLATLLAGGRIWAVIVNQVGVQALRMACFGWASRSDLALNFGWRRIRGLLSFGGWVLASNIIIFAARNADNLLIGAFLGASAVGIYGLAYQFMTLPLMAISWPASGVLLATLSARRGDEGFSVSRNVVSVTQATALLAFPMMTFMSFGLGFPVDQLLSPHWREVVKVIQILAFAGAIQSIGVYNGAVLLAAGHVRLQFVLNVFNALVLVAGFVVALPYGIQTFSQIYTVLSTGTTLVMLTVMIRYGGIAPLAYARSLIPPLAGSALGLAGVALVGFHQANWAQWAAAVAIFAGGVGLVYGTSHRAIRESVGVLIASRPSRLAGGRAGLLSKQDGRELRNHVV